MDKQADDEDGCVKTENQTTEAFNCTHCIQIVVKHFSFERFRIVDNEMCTLRAHFSRAAFSQHPKEPIFVLYLQHDMNGGAIAVVANVESVSVFIIGDSFGLFPNRIK